AIGMSLSTSFIIVVSSFFLWFINSFFLVPFDLTYLRVIVYILIISFSVQLLEIILKHTSPLLYRVLGIFLPLITTNCAVLAVPLFSLYLNYTLM
ncbi:electron transport complex subunit RsxA, partial [Buchnera aphidicola]|nr:electron transport complex subunit RsxA [Buchnera aphidicola]